jgi:hypothetical protein
VRFDDDPVLAALVREAAADDETVGLVLSGSRAAGQATAESDYDPVAMLPMLCLARSRHRRINGSRPGTRRWDRIAVGGK